jgi:DNA-binding response OmpR family regulator
MDSLPNDLRVLLIEDNDEHAAIISRHLRHGEGKSIHLSRASRLADGLTRLASDRFDALLLDLRLPDSDIHRTLERTLPYAAELPIIVLSTLEERVVASRAIKEGAQDYLCKSDLSGELLVRAIHQIMPLNGKILKREYEKRALGNRLCMILASRRYTKRRHPVSSIKRSRYCQVPFM